MRRGGTTTCQREGGGVLTQGADHHRRPASPRGGLVRPAPWRASRGRGRTRYRLSGGRGAGIGRPGARALLLASRGPHKTHASSAGSHGGPRDARWSRHKQKKSALSPRPALVGRQRVAWTAVSGREDAGEHRAPCAAHQSGRRLHRRRTAPWAVRRGRSVASQPPGCAPYSLSPASAGQWVWCPVWPREAGQRNERGTWLPPSNTVAVWLVCPGACHTQPAGSLRPLPQRWSVS